MDGILRLLLFAAFSAGVLIPSGAPALCAQTISPEQPTRFLVLNTGRVVSGRVIPRPDGFDVEVESGRLFISSESVRFQAESMAEAHRKLRASVPDLTPEVHIRIARWCIQNELMSAARSELLDALHLDPDRAEAKQMLTALERQRSGTSARNDELILRHQRTPRLETGPLPESRALGGFSPETARMFMQDVQPLLTNRCGSTGCHGPNGCETFRLELRRRSSARLASERNLASILRQINTVSPDNSALLRRAVSPHGGSPRSPLYGRSAAVQYSALRDWVRAVSEDFGFHNSAAPPGSFGADTSVRTAEYRFPASGDSQVSPASSERAAVPYGNAEEFHGRRPDESESDRKHIREAQDAARFDAFDPDYFNRVYSNRNVENGSPAIDPGESGSSVTSGSRKESR